jgi:DNA-binding transcriptional regulator GbsR (MarR family)
MKEESAEHKFMSFFKDVSFEVKARPIKKTKVSDRAVNATLKNLKKMLAKAKKDFNKAKKLHKINKISSDELFDWEFRVSEIKEDIKRFIDDNEDEDI